MGFFSILPASLSFIETFFVRLFLLLALLVAGPWLVALAYDFLLYIWRCVTYDIPYFGGRARGKRRPRVPSLTERSDGHKRQISLPSMLRVQHDSPSEGSTTALHQDSTDAKEKTMSRSLAEE